MIIIKIKNAIKYLHIFVVFFAITLFTSLSISTFQSIITDTITNKGYIDENYIACNITGTENIASKELLDVLKNNSEIYLEKNNLNAGAYTGKAIYSNQSINNSPNIIEGRYFDEEDFKNNKPVAIVGKELFNSINTSSNKKYFQYENIKFEIIGVSGYKNRSSLGDYSFYINLNGYISESKSNISLLDCIINSNKSLNNLISLLKNKSDKVEYKIDKKMDNNIVDSILVNGNKVLGLFSLVIIMIFINVFNITLQWVEEKKRSIGIKKALGATNFTVAKEIILEQQLIALISFPIAMIVYILIIKSNVLKIFNSQIYFLSTIISFVFSILVAFIVSLLAIKKSNKIPPSIIMRGGKQ